VLNPTFEFLFGLVLAS